MAGSGLTAKAVASKFIAQGAAQVPLSWMRALSGVSLVVPYYHMVSDGPVRHISHLYQFRTTAEFTADVEFLLRHFAPVSLSEIIDGLNGKRTFERPSFHLTFDDGFREMHDVVAPILQRAGAAATFFLNTAFLDQGGLAHHNQLSLLLERLSVAQLSQVTLSQVESVLPPAKGREPLNRRILALRYADKTIVQSLAEILGVDFDQYVREALPYLSSAQVKSMLDRGFSMGAHSHDHPLYSDLPLEQQVEQTRQSMEIVKQKFDVSLKSFAFPHTDTGVEAPFFDKVFSQQILDVSFGTAGLVSHFHPRNIERVSMEKTSAPAKQILAKQFARAMYHKKRRPQ